MRYSASITPLAPLLDDHVISHTIDHDAVNVPDALTLDECRYAYMQSESASSPSAGVHTRPGPAHTTGTEPGSPGSNTNRNGRATTVADNDPFTVAALAVADTSTNSPAGTHIHMSNLTTMFPRGGAEPNVGDGNRFRTVFAALAAISRGDGSAYQ